MSKVCWPAVAVAVLLAAACGRSQHRPTVASTRDSAGVTITETPTAAWRDTGGWTIDSAPLVDIGRDDGSEPYLLGRVIGSMRRSDGSIIVADGEAHQLRLYDSIGRFVSAGGRKGPGPGEFTFMEYMARCGPRQLWVVAGNRVSVWTDDLKFVREFTVRQNTMWPLICFGGAGLLVKRDLNNGDDPTTNTTRDDSLELIVIDSLGESPHDLMPIAIWRRIYLVESPPRVSFPNPFAAMTAVAADGRDLVVGTGRSLGFEVFDIHGRLLRIVRGPGGDLAFTPAMRRSYLSVPLAGEEKQMREWLGRAGNPFPSTVPAYSDIQVDAGGNIWVKRFATPGTGVNRWGVFGHDDRFLGHVAAPPGLKIMDIGNDYLLGMAADSSGAQHVRLYRLRRH